MTYLINKTDGSLLTEILDSAVDQTATDLTLIGKNVTGYGEYINENFVKLLENFSSTSEPNNPIIGQLWYDLSEERIKVYDGNGFKIAAGPIISSTRPISLSQGDFWIDNIQNQLYFNDGIDTVLVGPIWKESQGRSGFEIDSVLDSFGNLRTITKLWNNSSIVGIFSNHIEFTPSNAISGFTTIKTGFNVNSNILNFKMYCTATSAETLVDVFGNPVPLDELLSGNYVFENANIINIAIGNFPVDSSFTNSIFIKSGSNGKIRLSTESTVGNQEQYAIEISPGNVINSRSTTKLYGNVIISNLTAANTSGSSFRLPFYTNEELAQRIYTIENYGELIYNIDEDKIQAYTTTGWINLH